jgi:SPW repeat
MQAMGQSWDKEALNNLVNLVLGACLLLSPWLFAFVSEVAAG